MRNMAIAHPKRNSMEVLSTVVARKITFNCSWKIFQQAMAIFWTDHFGWITQKVGCWDENPGSPSCLSPHKVIALAQHTRRPQKLGGKLQPLHF